MPAKDIGCHIYRVPKISVPKIPGAEDIGWVRMRAVDGLGGKEERKISGVNKEAGCASELSVGIQCRHTFTRDGT